MAEKTKDAQIARDYRIPIPFGLTDQDAGDLAEEMARFIIETLHTPMSLGLHRDADRDALGNLGFFFVCHLAFLGLVGLKRSTPGVPER